MANNANYAKKLMGAAPKVVLAAALAGSASAAAAVDFRANTQANPVSQPGFYVGGNLGFFRGSGGEFDDNDNFIELLGGYKFNPYFSLEGSYVNFGRFGGDVASASIDGWTLAAVGSYPVTDFVNVYGKVGMLFSNVDIRMTEFDASYSDDQLFVGLGVNLTIMDPLTLSLEYNRHRFNIDGGDWPQDVGASDADLDTVKLGVKYHF